MDVHQNFIIVHGGIMDVTQELNDMYAYDVKSNQWFCVFRQVRRTHRPVA